MPKRGKDGLTILRAATDKDVEVFRRSRLRMKRDRISADDEISNAVRV
jgi:hypothetical protein